MEVMSAGYVDAVEKLRSSGRPFAVATVINVKGSASAKPGSRAVIDETGKNVWGWVGGGCAESFVGNQALEAIEENRTRIVQADLDDEIFGLGMPCGGIMDVFIQPQLPPETLEVQEDPELEPIVRHLAESYGFRLQFTRGKGERPARSHLERAVYALALALGKVRQASLQPLRETKGVYAEAEPNRALSEGDLLILGHSRITEEIAKLGALLRWPTRVYGPDLDVALYPEAVVLEDAGPGYENLRVSQNTKVIVASHHKGDHEFIRIALEQNADYVGLIASQKRSGLVFEHLRMLIPEERLHRIHAPAGLDLGCKTPQEIALSCIAELIQLQTQHQVRS